MDGGVDKAMQIWHQLRVRRRLHPSTALWRNPSSSFSVRRRPRRWPEQKGKSPDWWTTTSLAGGDGLNRSINHQLTPPRGVQPRARIHDYCVESTSMMPHEWSNFDQLLQRNSHHDDKLRISPCRTQQAALLPIGCTSWTKRAGLEVTPGLSLGTACGCRMLSTVLGGSRPHQRMVPAFMNPVRSPSPQQQQRHLHQAATQEKNFHPEMSGLSSSSLASSTATPSEDEIWEKLTQRLLQPPDPSVHPLTTGMQTDSSTTTTTTRFTSFWIHEWALTIRWWARQRPRTGQTVSTLWQLWYRFLDRHDPAVTGASTSSIESTLDPATGSAESGPRSAESLSPPPSHEEQSEKIVVLLNLVLDHWRWSIKEGVMMSATPPSSSSSSSAAAAASSTTESFRPRTMQHYQIPHLDQVEQMLLDLPRRTGGAIQPNQRSFALLIGAMAYTTSPPVDPRRAQALLDLVLDKFHQSTQSPTLSPSSSSPPPHVVLWNAVMTVWVKSGVSQAAEEALALLRRMQSSPHLVGGEHLGGGPSHVSYALALEALLRHQEIHPGVPLVSDTTPGPLDIPEQALHLWQESQRANQSSAVGLLHVLQIWSKSPRSDGADRGRALLQQATDAYLQYQAKQQQNLAQSDNHHINSDQEHGDVAHAMSEPEESLLVWDDEKHLDRRQHDQPVKPSLACFSAVMSGCARRRMTDQVETVLQNLQNLYEQTGDVDFLPTTFLLNSVLEAYVVNRQLDKAQLLLERMHRMALQLGRKECMPDAVSFNTVLNGWAQSDLPDAANRCERLLKSMQQSCKDVRPTCYTYTIAMNAWARSGQRGAAERCEAFLRAMWKAYDAGDQLVKPSEVTYSTNIYAWSRSGHPDAPLRAEALYQDMLNRLDIGNDGNYKPQEFTYVSLMNTWTRSDRPEAVERSTHYFDKFLSYCKAPGASIRPSHKLYNAQIESKRGDGRAAEQVLQEMLSDYEGGNELAQPPLKPFHSAMFAWAKSRSKEGPERVEALLSLMNELHDKRGLKNLSPTAYTFSILLDSWAKSGRYEAPMRAEDILWRMHCLSEAGDESLSPSSLSYAIVLNAWTESRLPDAPYKAEILFDKMMQRYEAGNTRLRPSSQTYNNLITCWARSELTEAPKKALAILDEMEERHRVDGKNEMPNCFHYASVINAFANKGDFIMAESILDRIIAKDGISPHRSCFTAVLKAYTRSDSPQSSERALRLLRRMVDEFSFLPEVGDYFTCLAILQKSERLDAYIVARSIVTEMVERAEAGQGKIAPKAGTFSALLRILRKRSNKEELSFKIKEIAELAERAGLTPSGELLREIRKSRSAHADPVERREKLP